MVNSIKYSKLSIPTERESLLSLESSRILASYVQSKQSSYLIKVVEENGHEQSVSIPPQAFYLLIDILSQMARGNAVTLIPIHAELTIQQAAAFLNVSRNFLLKLIESNEIASHKVGRQVRIRFEDLMSYKQKIDAQRMEVLDQLVAQAQELDMGYD